MDNKSILKALVAGVNVYDANAVYYRILDYSIQVGQTGDLVYTAGCVDQSNVYRQIPCEALNCGCDLSGVKYGQIPWTRPYSVADVIQAMQAQKPVVAAGISYQSIARLSIVLDAQRNPRYAVTVKDFNRHLVTVAPEKLQLVAEASAG